jgi:uncharacterized membrane protein YdjX (TVP38/TMEM64 family)
MGLDTECDLAVETSEDDARESIARFRAELLAEHLGTDRESVSREIERRGSLLAAIDALSGGERCLDRFDPSARSPDVSLLSARDVFDPERPIPFEELRDQLSETPEHHGRGATLLRIALAVAIPVVLLALWKIGPLADSISPESLADAASWLDDHYAGAAIGLLVFVSAALLLVPVVSLIVASALVFGFVEGTAIALIGSVASAAAGYAIGRVLWRDAVRRLAGPRLDRLNDHLSKRGLVATAIVRVVPVAPFAVVNLVAGASHVRLRDFVLGTALGMAPGTAALAFFGERAAEAARDPSAGSIALVALAVAVLVTLAMLMRRLLTGDEAGEGSGS